MAAAVAPAKVDSARAPGLSFDGGGRGPGFSFDGDAALLGLSEADVPDAEPHNGALRASLQFTVLDPKEKERYRRSVEFKILSKMYNRTKQKRETHLAAANHFHSRSMFLLFPAVFITFSASVVTVVGDKYPEHAHVFAMATGILASVATLMQVISSTLNYNSKGDQHLSAYQEYCEVCQLVLYGVRGLIPEARVRKQQNQPRDLKVETQSETRPEPETPYLEEHTP